MCPKIKPFLSQTSVVIYRWGICDEVQLQWCELLSPYFKCQELSIAAGALTILFLESMTQLYIHEYQEIITPTRVSQVSKQHMKYKSLSRQTPYFIPALHVFFIGKLGKDEWEIYLLHEQSGARELIRPRKHNQEHHGPMSCCFITLDLLQKTSILFLARGRLFYIQPHGLAR